ncbi:GNAT family N-acetyltransferase [Sphingopyxis sp. MWB1]|uniref:GNAT family N-acetyltransferase n=1 Tax=Sphingopyxis sp. MWB1 TaxID=1537715 RepID=UPI00068F4651|nr:GNAT family N-acetyltransferase [Sphingopyxis sp. MWB1]
MSDTDIEFRPIETADLPALRRWFGDNELARRLSFPDDIWFAHVTRGADASCWVAAAAGTPIARFQLETAAGGTAYIDIGLRPDLRGQGLGRRLLEAFLAGPARFHARVAAFIEPDHHASLRCFSACGFRLSSEVDADGMIRADWTAKGEAA